MITPVERQKLKDEIMEELLEEILDQVALAFGLGPVDEIPGEDTYGQA